MVAVALRGWQLTHTEVASRDSIGFIRIAWRLEHGPWRQVLRDATQHPGYPVALLAVSWPVRRLLPGDLPYLMQVSAQITSAVASVLLLFPTFYLGRELFGRRIGFWAALFFQCLPASGRGMADGLSEPIFLLAATTALAFGSRALRKGTPTSFLAAGACSGLAYLARPEGLLIAGLTAVVVLAMQASSRWRQPWTRVLACTVCLVLALVAVGGPYAWAIGNWTAKHTAQEVVLPQGKQADVPVTSTLPLPVTSGQLLAVWYPHRYDAPPSERTWWGLVTLLEMLTKGFFYVFWVPALLGLWWFRDRFLAVPGAWLLASLCAALALLLYRVAYIMGYLSDRHALLIVLGGSYFAVAALDRIGQSAATLLARIRPTLGGTRWACGTTWSAGVLLTAVLCPLPRTLERLHFERTGFRDAGYWLAQHACPGDYVLDPYCWAHYYAGRVFTEGLTGLPAQQPPVWYMVVEEGDNKHSNLAEHQAAIKMRPLGRLVQHWEVRRGKDRAAIVVYELPMPPAPAP
jgi:hypothetical protein